MYGQKCRGVVPRIDALQGVGGDGFAQVGFFIAAAHTLVDGIGQIAVDMYILPQLHKNTGHTGVLADGKFLLRSNAEILLQKP